MDYKKIFNTSIFINILKNIYIYSISIGLVYTISKLIQYAMEKNYATTIKYSFILLIVLIISSLIIYFLNKISLLQKDKVKQTFLKLLYNNFLNLTLANITKGEFQTRITKDTSVIVNFYTNHITNAIGNTIIIVASSILLCSIHMKLALILIIINFIQLIPSIVYKKWAQKNYSDSSQLEDEAYSWFGEGYLGLEQIKNYQAQHWFLNRLKDINNKLKVIGTRSETTGMIENFIFNTINSILTYGVYVLVGYVLYIQQITIAEAMMIILLSSYLFGGMEPLYEFINKLNVYRMAKKRLNYFYRKEKSNIIVKLDNVSSEAIKFDNISYSYDDKIIFSSWNNVINKGDKVLLTGPNGTGKSTLIRMILGLSTLKEGNIFISSKLPISFLLQEESNFGITGIQLANILQKEHNIELDKTYNIWNKLNISEDLLTHHNIEDLSGGEKKKLMLGLALSENSNILILDEPTNSLDDKSIDVLINLLIDSNKTLLISSHDKKLKALGFREISLSNKNKGVL